MKRRLVDQVTIVSEDAAEQADCVACVPTGSAEYFPDDIRTHCARCGRSIHHRPHVPTTRPKLCLACAMGGPDGGTPEDWRRYISSADDDEGKEAA